MKSDILLSIVVPVFNTIKFIEPTLRSLQEILKEREDIEIIIQDAVSTDGTTEVIARYVEQESCFIHYVEKDGGQSYAINRGIRKARGQWVTWLCADDLLLPGFSQILKQLESTEGGVVYGDCVMLLESGEIVPAFGTETHEPGALARKRLILQQPGTCIRRAHWEALQGVDVDLNWVMDYDLFLRLEGMGVAFLRLNEFVAVARIHSEAKTSSGSFRRVLEHWRMFGRAHGRNLQWVSWKPYALYGIEYIIKTLEAGNSCRGIVPSLHKAFWLLGRPQEQQAIQSRLQQQKEGIHLYIQSLQEGMRS